MLAPPVYCVLGDRDLHYCVLHGWQASLDCSDVDIAIAADDLKRIAQASPRLCCGEIVQLVQHEASCYYLVLAVRREGAVRFIGLDCCVDYRRDGRVFFTVRELLRRRERIDGLWVAAPEIEFAYVLVKKILKGTLPGHQKIRMQRLLGQLGSEACSIVDRMLGARWGNKVTGWLGESDWCTLEAHLPHLKRVLRQQVIRRDPLNPVRYYLPELQRRWMRWRHPTGLCIAVVGSDGAGKSTLIERLKEDLAGAFRHTVVFHLRPSLRGPVTAQRPATDPHGKPPHPPWVSLFKLAYYAMIYTLGYLAAVRPRLVRSTLVFFDRYYDDLLVDPRRYRYGGSARLAHHTRRLIPRPDLVLVLDVPEGELSRRKQEVSTSELRRQRAAYRRLAADLPNAVLLDGSLPIDEVARHASDAILDHLRRRYLRRRSLWFTDNRSDTLGWLTTVVCHPAEDVRFDCLGHGSRRASDHTVCGTFGWLALEEGRAYLIPLDSRKVASRGLDVFNPQSLKARLAKGLIGTGLRLGLGRRLLPQVQLVARNGTGGDESNALLLEYFKDVLARDDLSIAVSLGTPGPHRKPVLLVLTGEGKAIAYVKLGSNPATNALIEREANVLERLANRSFRGFTVPHVIHTGWWNGRYMCMQSAPEGKTRSPSSFLASQYLDILRELASTYLQWMPLEDSGLWKDLMRCLDESPDGYCRSVLERGVRRAEDWSRGARLPFYFSHGDFVPWNIKLNGNKIFVFDWEYAQQTGLPGRDVFHYIFQTMRFLRKRSPRKIFELHLKDRELRSKVQTHLASLGLTDIPQEFCLLLYALERVATTAATNPGDGALHLEIQSFVNVLNLR